MLPFDIVYVWIYYAGGRGAIIPVSGPLSPTEAILESNTTEGGIAFQLFSEDMSPFFVLLLFFSGYFLILAGV